MKPAMITAVASTPVDAAERSEAAAREEEIEAVFDQCSRGLYRYVIVRTGGDVHLADDIMQHVWLAVLRRGRALPPAEIEFWLKRVAKDALRAHWRRTLSRPKHVPLPDASLAGRLARQLETELITSEVLERREVCDQILLALTELPTVEQQLIIDRYCRGRTLAELAETLGITERAVEGRLYRARRAIKKALTEL